MINMCLLFVCMSSAGHAHQYNSSMNTSMARRSIFNSGMTLIPPLSQVVPVWQVVPFGGPAYSLKSR